MGVDGQTAADYEKDLEGNLRSLFERAKSGSYWAPPVRRVHIPKGTGAETRPIGIPTLEDKVLQRAIVMLLEPIYEWTSMTARMGSGRRRSAHDALDSLSKQTMWSGGELYFGGRHPKIFRHFGSRPSAGVSPTTDTRWRGAPTDRQVAQRGGAGRRSPHDSRNRYTSRWSDDAPNNVAKPSLIPDSVISRTRLRPKYGHGGKPRLDLRPRQADSRALGEEESA